MTRYNGEFREASIQKIKDALQLRAAELSREAELPREAALAAHHGDTLHQDTEQLLLCDIFIVYRRKGGSDFAQLLKVCFKSMGLEVFLDVDNLGQVR
jgi:hypothetical protein